MTSQGSPYSRFQRALTTDSLHLIRAAAAELPRIGIAEAAAMLLAIHRIEPETYPRAAVRWVGKLCNDTGVTVELAELAQLAAALDELPSAPSTAQAALADVCTRAGLREAARIFAR